MKITPLHLEILLHYYSSSAPFEGGPISFEYSRDLKDFGLVAYNQDGSRITPRGIQIVHAILDVASIAAR